MLLCDEVTSATTRPTKWLELGRWRIHVNDARDRLNENGDIDYLMSLGPVQPTGVFMTTEIFVSGQGRRSLWDRGDMSPNIYEGETSMVYVPPIF